MTAIAALSLVTPPNPKAGRTITKERLAVADQHQLSKRTSHEMLNDLISIITKRLQKGERVKIAGLGILHVPDRAARIGRNLKTGEAVEIKGGEKVSSRAAKKLKMAIWVGKNAALR
jgi:DNA-binding protein HU-beta